MINAEKIIFEKQNYYTPSWSGVTTVKILEVLPKGKVRVKAGKSEYYGAAEPPVRCGESHLSGLTEPPQFVY